MITLTSTCFEHESDDSFFLCIGNKKKKRFNSLGRHDVREKPPCFNERANYS